MKTDYSRSFRRAIFLLCCAASVTVEAYDWSGRTGTVTLTEADGEVEVNDGDISVVAALTGIVLSGENAKIIFRNTTDLALSGTITGEGTIYKRGVGNLWFGKPHAVTIRKTCDKTGTDFNGDYYTTGGIRVEVGTLYLPQDGGAMAWYGPLTVAAGATVVTPPDVDIGFDTLNGSGSITNLVAFDKKLVNPTVWASYYGETAESCFAGSFDGRIAFQASGNVQLSGIASQSAGNVIVARNTYDSNDGHGLLAVSRFGRKGEASSVGRGDLYQYSAGDILLKFGGRIDYVGEGEETDKTFGFYGNQTYVDKWIDAGAVGGVTFTGAWTLQDKYMTSLVLTGSNTEEMVLANEINTAHANGGIMNLKKCGSGTWRLADHAQRNIAGAWFVEEGTLRYDSIADVGKMSALGTQTDCYPWMAFGDPAVEKTEAKRLPYEISLGSAKSVPTFDYSGDGVWSSTTNRRIVIAGQGARFSNNSVGGKVKLLGGVTSAPGDAAEKTIYLSGTNVVDSTIGNIADGDGKLSIVKEGSGSWRLTGTLAATGSLEARAGRLSISPRGGRPYRWYRLTITKLGGVHDWTETPECPPGVSSGYVRLRGLGLYKENGDLYKPDMTDAFPDDIKFGSESYIYPARFWQSLEPGQVTIGEYHGTEYHTYKDANELPSNLFKDTFSVYNTTLKCTPDDDHPALWLPIVFRLPEGAPEIRYFDVVCDRATDHSQGHVAHFRFEGSTDGVNWTLLHNQGECVHSHSGSMASNPSVNWSAGANCVDGGFGFPIAGRDAAGSVETGLDGFSEVKVAPGATLDAEGAISLPRLTVDCAGLRRATVSGFAIAETGVLSLENVPSGNEFVLPVDFIGCSDLANLSGWQVSIGGRIVGKFDIVVNGNEVTLRKRGFILILK